MSDRGDALRELIEKAPLRAALRAVILYNSDMITKEFRLKVLREEIRLTGRECSRGSQCGGSHPAGVASVRGCEDLKH